MTIRVIIKNEEAKGGRTVTVTTMMRPRGLNQEKWGDTSSVAPGEQREFYVHAAQHLIVEEIP